MIEPSPLPYPVSNNPFYVSAPPSEQAQAEDLHGARLGCIFPRHADTETRAGT